MPMDGSVAIENNRQALKRIVAMLFAMAGMGFGGRLALPALHPPVTLPRHLRLVILRLLRPAEAAARRLIIAAARGLVVALPPARPRKPAPTAAEPVLRRLGIAVTVSRDDLRRAAARRAAAMRAARPRGPSLPLLDPLQRPFRPHRARRPAHAVPRISGPGFSLQSSFRAPRSPDDPVDAVRLGRRLAALAAALDDLPGQAGRFARWRARRDVADALEKQGGGRFRRVSPLRTGRPPGGRLSRYDPGAIHPRNVREVDEILAHAHALAMFALRHPDTS